MAKGPSSTRRQSPIQRDRAQYRSVLDKIKVQERNAKLPDQEEVGGRDSDVLGILKVRIREEKPKQQMEKKPAPEENRVELKYKLAAPRGPGPHQAPGTSGTQPGGPAGASAGGNANGPASQINFNVPTTRGTRPTTDDGRTSFHFSHDSISKTRKEVETDKGLKNRPGAAQAHMKYLERAGAIAEIDGLNKTPEQLELERLALAEEQGVNVNSNDGGIAVEPKEQTNVRFDGEAFTATISRHAIALRESIAAALAGRRNAGTLAGVPLLSSLDVVSHDTKADVPLWSDEHNRMEWQGAAGNGMRWERSSGGEIVVRAGNLEPDNEAAIKPEGGFASKHGSYLERQEAIARMGDGSLVLFTNIPGDAEDRAKVWDVIEEYEDDPKSDVIRVNVSRTPDFWARISSNPDCPKELLDAIAAADPTVTDPDKIKSFNVEDESVIRKWLTAQDGWDANEPQGKFGAARGGRIQYRIIGELPHEITSAERASILEEYVQIFEEKKLPYVAVMHAPDHTNDARNWHFHIVYYDRPINKMPDGKWDFTIKEKYVDKTRWYYGTRWPHRQDKVREVAEKPWVPMLRKRLADITNDHLERSKIERRLDPRKYAEMGIEREPQQHLGTKLSALEAMGMVTPIGAENANKDWDALLRSVLDRREKADKRTDAQGLKWTNRVERIIKNPMQASDIKTEIDVWSDKQKESTEYRLMSDMVLRTHEKTISRAERTVENCRKKLAAIAGDKTNGFVKRQKAAITEREQAALDHIHHCKTSIAADLVAAQNWADIATLRQVEADKMAMRIDLAINSATATRPSPQFDRMIEEAQAKQAAAVDPSVAEAVKREQDAAQRRMLSQAEINAFVQMLADQKRRIEHKDRKYVPVVLAPGEAEIVNALNYQAISTRLKGLKTAQDGLIAEVAAFIQKNPASVSRKMVGPGREEIVLDSDRKTFQSAFTLYGNEPAILAATRDALYKNDTDKVLADLSRGYTPPVAVVPVITPPAPQPVERRDLAPVLDQIAKAPVRIAVVNGKFKPDRSLLKALGLNEADIDTPMVQRRLKGIQGAQERDIRRVEGYVRSRPDALVEVNGKMTLSPKAPQELLAIASKWTDDTDLQASLRKIAEAAKNKVGTGGGTTTTAGTTGGRPADRIEAKPVEADKPVVPVPVAPESAADRAARLQREQLAREAAERRGVRPVDPNIIARNLDGKAAPVRGVHPKIDAWLDAEKDGRPDAVRNKIAAAVISDRKARGLVDTIDPKVGDRIKHEAGLYRQSQSIGRQREIDFGPRNSR